MGNTASALPSKGLAVSPIGLIGDGVQGERPEALTGDFYTSSDTKGNTATNFLSAPGGILPGFSGMPTLPNVPGLPSTPGGLPGKPELPGLPNNPKLPKLPDVPKPDDLLNLQILEKVTEGKFDILENIHATNNGLLSALQNQQLGLNNAIIGQTGLLVNQVGQIRSDFTSQVNGISSGIRGISSDITGATRHLGDKIGDVADRIEDKVEDRMDRTERLIDRGFDTTNKAFDTVDRTLQHTNMAIANVSKALEMSAVKTELLLGSIGKEIQETQDSLKQIPGQVGGSLGSSLNGLATTALIVGGVVVGGLAYVELNKK